MLKEQTIVPFFFAYPTENLTLVAGLRGGLDAFACAFKAISPIDHISVRHTDGRIQAPWARTRLFHHFWCCAATRCSAKRYCFCYPSTGLLGAFGCDWGGSTDPPIDGRHERSARDFKLQRPDTDLQWFRAVHQCSAGRQPIARSGSGMEWIHLHLSTLCSSERWSGGTGCKALVPDALGWGPTQLQTVHHRVFGPRQIWILRRCNTCFRTLSIPGELWNGSIQCDDWRPPHG